MPQSILEMAKDLVMTQVQSGALSPEDMHKELQKTYATLMELKGLEEAVATGTVAISRPTERGSIDAKGKPERPLWRKSIKKSSIECIECGALFKQLSVRHLKDHDLDARSYRLKYGIPRTQPLSARDTTAMRKEIIQQSKPWEKAPTYIKAHTLKSGSGAPTKTASTRKKASKKAS